MIDGCIDMRQINVLYKYFAKGAFPVKDARSVSFYPYNWS